MWEGAGGWGGVKILFLETGREVPRKKVEHGLLEPSFFGWTGYAGRFENTFAYEVLETKYLGGEVGVQ